MDDVIYRHDAIDAALSLTFFRTADELREHVANYGLTQTRNAGISDVISSIKNLPSAEYEYPEWAQEVERMYNKALTKPYIKNPLAWALHEVWKEYDEDG